jgi:hypothetical protein
MEALESWHEWYSNHQGVAELNKPLKTKDSRENLHNTKQIFSTMTDADLVNRAEKEILEWMGDTLVQGLERLSGARLYELIVQATKENLDYTKKEYLKALEVYQLLSGNVMDENNG